MLFEVLGGMAFYHLNCQRTCTRKFDQNLSKKSNTRGLSSEEGAEQNIFQLHVCQLFRARNCACIGRICE